MLKKDEDMGLHEKPGSAACRGRGNKEMLQDNFLENSGIGSMYQALEIFSLISKKTVGKTNPPVSSIEY